MQHYIYGNLHHAGFQTVSSDTTGFFMNNAAALSHLMVYDDSTNHGELKTGEHKCFWLLTAGLMDLKNREYLFIQESGLDPYRTAAVVQGYRSDVEDHEEDLFGPNFLSLLDTRFVSNREAMRIGEEEQLHSISLKELPKSAVEEKKIATDVLKRILLTLFEGKRAIVRIPVLGAEAMKCSRGYLKTIYQCLPYAKRRSNGCITGATGGMKLPRGLRIVLMDADADISGMSTNAKQTVFDLNHVEAIQKKKVPYLVDFLVDATQEQRDNFFQYCRVALREDGVEGDPSIPKYSTLLDEYQLGDAVLASEDIRKWAVNLYDDVDRSKERVKEILKKIAKALTAQNLVEYLTKMAETYESVHRFGVLVRADRNHDENAERDQNAALTLRMMMELPEYDRDSIQNDMKEHFVALARVEYPCLTLEAPYKDTLDDCDRIKLPGAEDGRNPWTNELMEQIRGELETKISNQKKLYGSNHQSQKVDGEAKIKEFDGWELENLYKELQQYYLHSELMDVWNEKIGDRIKELCCAWPKPRELDGYPQMHTRLCHMREVFTSHGGKLTKEQNRALHELEQKWKDIQTLAAQKCTAAKELEQWLKAADAVDWDPELREDQKREKANALLLRIPDGLSLEETKDRLTCAVTNEKLLREPEIEFLPWAVKAAPKEIQEQIKMLERYPNAGVPNLNNKKLRSWIVQMLPENKDLMVCLIQKYPAKQAEWLPILAKNGKGITREDIRKLYLSGCTRKELCGQRDASAQWRQAVEDFWSELPSLPEPLKTPPPRRKTVQTVLLIAVQILLGLAVLAPGVVLLMTGGSVLAYGIVVGTAVLCAGGFTGAAFIPKAKPVRGILMGLALALAPGILAGVAGIVMCFL